MSLAEWEDEGADMAFSLPSDFLELAGFVGQVISSCCLRFWRAGQDSGMFSGSAHGQCDRFHCIRDGETDDVQRLGLFFQAVLELDFVPDAECS